MSLPTKPAAAAPAARPASRPAARPAPAAVPAPPRGVFASFAPQDQSEGGGLIDNIKARIMEIRFELYDYPKSDGTPTAVDADGNPNALCVGVALMDPDGNEFVEHYSLGAKQSENWRPTEDGNHLEPVDPEKIIKLNSGTKGLMLINSLVNCGFATPEEMADGDISRFVGCCAFFSRENMPDWNGKRKRDDNRQDTVLLPVKAEDPFEPQPKGVPAPAGKPAATPAAAKPSARPANRPAAAAPAPVAAPAADADAIDIAALEAVQAVLASKPGVALTKVQLNQGLFAAVPKDANRKLVMTRAYSDEFLNEGAEAGYWAFDGAQISATE